MAPGALDPLTKEMVYVAISSSNGCRYCVRSHTAAARKGGMSEQMLGELLAVVGMCNETNRLVQAYDGAVLPAVIALAATLLLLIIIIIIIISLSLSACVEEEAALPLSVLSLSVLSLSLKPALRTAVKLAADLALGWRLCPAVPVDPMFLQPPPPPPTTVAADLGRTAAEVEAELEVAEAAAESLRQELATMMRAEL